jgi:hypothetical protein
MQTASLLLSVIPDVENNKLIITGKIFEYIGAGRPVFLVGPSDCDAARIVSISQSGTIHGYNEKEKMKQTLLYQYDLFKNGRNQNVDSLKEKYSRKNLTGELAELLDKLTTKKQG